MSEELKACPFCGSSHVTKGLTGATEKFLGISNSDRNRLWFAHIQCLDCGTKQGRLESYIMDGRDDEEAYTEAITAWNTRATDAENQRLRAEVEALRAHWAALDKALQESIIENDKPHRVKWEGEWHTGPLADAYFAMTSAVRDLAKQALTRKAPQ